MKADPQGSAFLFFDGVFFLWYSFCMRYKGFNTAQYTEPSFWLRYFLVLSVVLCFGFFVA